MTAIEANSLTRTFGDLAAVDRLSLRVEAGEIFGLVGPDGAGKTTTMRLLAAVMEPTSGRARVLGRDVVEEADEVRRRIGYMSQRFGLYPDLTVLENIHFYADLYGVARRGRDEKIEDLLAFSNLTPFKRRRAGHLSGGMKQKLGLACALIHTPEVLFLDEPTNGVDPVSRRDFWRILYRLVQRGVTIFVSTAYLDEAERCGRLGLLNRGHLLAEGSPDRVKGLMPGTVLEVHLRPARLAVPILREAFPESSVGVFGDRVHVVTSNPERVARRIRDVLSSDRFELEEIRPVDPTIEDLFIAMLTTPRKEAELHV